VAALERRVHLLDIKASSSLIAAERTLEKIRAQMSPVLYVSDDIKIASEAIQVLLKKIKKMHEDPTLISRDKRSLILFESQVHMVFNREIPSYLARLEKFLTSSSDNCEIMDHLGNTAMSTLPELRHHLGLVRPWFIFSSWAWDNSPRAQERLRIYNSVEELFQESRVHCEQLNKTEISFRKYRESQDLFRVRLQPYRYLSTMDFPFLPSVEESLARASLQIDALDEITTLAEAERRKLFKLNDFTEV
ncbi:hypothetical protein FRC01_010190, partial [Tulasnella sp. 417]